MDVMGFVYIIFNNLLLRMKNKIHAKALEFLFVGSWYVLVFFCFCFRTNLKLIWFPHSFGTSVFEDKKCIKCSLP